MKELDHKTGDPKAPCIAVLGTGSEVGKSIVTAALCRVFSNRNLRVAPFKAQNMSNNSGVTPEGLEMGRAQIVQAEAARIPPHVDMNPILLKPTSDVGAQVVLRGKAVGNSSAGEYHQQKETLLSEACAALDRLRRQYELIVMEGAGSCAEVNLMAHDIVNFKMAEHAGAPVILVADIHRGGVFAQIVGTLQCLPREKRDRVAGVLINRFRGDMQLFSDGRAWIEDKTGKRVFGVLPWYDDIRIESEDSVVIENPGTLSDRQIERPAVAVIRLPHISNFTDFDPLQGMPGLHLYFLEKVQKLDAFEAVVLPGSKNTRFDLQWLHDSGWAIEIRRLADRGGHVLGICGGYQMLGSRVNDPQGLEGTPGFTAGLDLLPVETTLKAPKTTTRTRFSWNGIEAVGYEIHMGQTVLRRGRPLFRVLSQNNRPCSRQDGCRLENENVLGTYIHGLFDNPAITGMWLESIGLRGVRPASLHGPAARDRDYDRLADHFIRDVDVEAIAALIGS
jgi:adenosylcobyric acid synthase